METLTLADIATWFGAGCGLAVVPYALFLAVRVVWHGVAEIGSNDSTKPDL